jgi:hypothetical protein
MRESDYQGSWRYRRHLSIVACLLLVFLLGTTVAHAITIVIDGDRDPLWDGAGGQTPGTIVDPNEGNILDNVDIEQFQFTNDGDNFYFLIDTHASTPSLLPQQYVDICLDTDNDTGTTIHPDNIPQMNRCAEVVGIDTVVRILNQFGSIAAGIVNVTGPTEVFIGSGVAALNSSATTPVIEVSVPLSDLGLSLAACTEPIQMVVYYDGASTDPDDNLPDRGATNITCGSPTAVSMHSASAVANSPVSSNALLAGLVLTIVSGGVILRRERHA